MIVSMQGNWTVRVKSKNAKFPQRFVISGAISGNGTHAGTANTTVSVVGSQWTIAIQNDPGTGFQLSDTQIKFPQKVGNTYQFEIWSNDAGGDADFNDLILTCSTPATINDFVIYGNVSLYRNPCIINPCFRRQIVIETWENLQRALLNPRLRDVLERLYPERVKVPEIPNPPDPPPYFKPIVLDLFDDASQPRTAQVFKRIEQPTRTKASKGEELPPLSVSNFELIATKTRGALPTAASFSQQETLDLAKIKDGLVLNCLSHNAPNITLSFEEYDRTAAELAGGAYTGTGSRRILGDAITDMNGNYIFRFSFDLTFPGLEDASDIAPGEDVNVIPYPDVIVKVTSFSPYTVLYESAPYNNIPNLKRIDLCLPQSSVTPSSVCFNGNLIGSLGNVFLGGDQNTTASFSTSALQRYGDGNSLEANGKISVGSSLAGFSIDCAPWGGAIDFKGCMYDAAKTASQNTIKWYTMRIKRQGPGAFQFVSENYKHPKFSKRHLPNYIGDDVGPFSTALHVDGAPAKTEVPAYKNIQREIFVDGVDWEFSNFDRYMQLHTALYDVVAGERTPGTFYVRVDGYDAAGQPVPGATDQIALYVHNLPLKFDLVAPSFSDSAINYVGCGLYRLTQAQLNSAMQLSFRVNDSYGSVNHYDLSVHRCPAPMLALRVNQPNPPLSDTLAGVTTLAQGSGATTSPPNSPHLCPGYTGTIHDFSDDGLIAIELQPALSEGGWLKTGEQFSVLTFELRARKRITNGYNTGLSSLYYTHSSIYLELMA